MSLGRLIVSLSSADVSIHFLNGGCRLSPPLLIPLRGKKTAKKVKKQKKDQQLIEKKEYMKQIELQKMMQSSALKAAKYGEPFDPEMINPVRKRQPSSLTPEEEERRFLLVKKWSRYKMQKDKEQQQLLYRMVQSREKALKELKDLSSSLYCKALQLNPKLFPLECKGPTATPPIPSYIPPDPEDE